METFHLIIWEAIERVSNKIISLSHGTAKIINKTHLLEYIRKIFKLKFSH